jgi:hypothetical protein
MAADDGSGGGGGSSNDIFWIALIFVALLIGAWFLFHTQLSFASLYIIVYSLKIVSPLFPAAGQYANALGHADPSRFSFADIKTDYALAGDYWMYIIIPVILFFAFKIYTGSNIQKYTRVMNFNQLKLVQSENFPVILPAVRSRLRATSRREGPWRWADTPYEWSLRNKVLTPSANLNADGTPLYFFDDRQAERALSYGWIALDHANLVESLKRMTPARRALAFALARWSAGDFRDASYATAGGNKLLAHLNTTFHYYEAKGDPLSLFLYNFLNMETDEAGKNLASLKKFAKIIPFMYFTEEENPRCDFTFDGDAWPVLDAKDTSFKGDKSERDLRIRTWQIMIHFAKRHSYDIPFLMALLDRASKQETAVSNKDSIRGARTYMPLPVSAFLWLKPIDREAFYALNNLGRHATFVESSGLVAHYRAEKKRKACSERPLVFNAVSALRRALSEESWLDDSTIPKR